MGPQSQADAYEALAYRDKRRRESTSELASGKSRLVQERNTKGNRILSGFPFNCHCLWSRDKLYELSRLKRVPILASNLEWKDEC